jgi:hypothetical protein
MRRENTAVNDGYCFGIWTNSSPTTLVAPGMPIGILLFIRVFAIL